MHRFGTLLDAYGADVARRREVAAATPAANRSIADIIEDNALPGNPAFGRPWQRAKGMHRRASQWLCEHSDDLISSSR